MISFEPVILNEVNSLAEISKITFYDTYNAYNTPDNMQQFIEQKYHFQKLESEILNAKIKYFFLRNDNEIVGYCRLNFAPFQTKFQDEKSIQIERFYVLPHHKNKGWGSILMKNIINWLKPQSIDYIWLGVWRKNQSAIDFYKKMGFYKFSEEIFMLGTDPQEDDLMRFDLMK